MKGERYNFSMPPAQSLDLSTRRRRAASSELRSDAQGGALCHNAYRFRVATRARSISSMRANCASQKDCDFISSR